MGSFEGLTITGLSTLSACLALGTESAVAIITAYFSVIIYTIIQDYCMIVGFIMALFYVMAINFFR